MHMRSQHELAKIEAHNRKRYSWTVCPLLARMIENGRSADVQAAFEKTERLHMTGNDNSNVPIQSHVSGIKLEIRRICDPLPGFTDMDTFLKKFKNPVEWKATPKLPPVNVHMALDITGQDNAWTLNAKRLAILNPPLSFVTRALAGDICLQDAVNTPYLDGFSIHSIWWNGQEWMKGMLLRDNPCAEMNVSGAHAFQSDVLEIMLATDIQPAKIEITA